MKLPKNIRKVSPFGRMTISRSQELILDTLWAKAVKSRAASRCEMCCQRKESLQAHHVIGRRNKTVRHIVSNGCSLCATHHMYAEQNGIAFAKWILQSRGEQWWNDLQIESRKTKVWKEFSIVKAYLETFL